MRYIAHRGYSIRYRDNSIEGIREAIHREYDGVEIDNDGGDTNGKGYYASVWQL